MIIIDIKYLSLKIRNTVTKSTLYIGKLLGTLGVP